MKNATEYLARVKALILVSPHVVPSETVREEAEGNMGLFRYRLRLQDDSLLAVFEPFEDELRCRFPIARSTSNPVTSNVQPATFNLQRSNVQPPTRRPSDQEPERHPDKRRLRRRRHQTPAVPPLDTRAVSLYHAYTSDR